MFAVLVNQANLFFSNPLVDASGVASAVAAKVKSSSSPNSVVPLNSFSVVGEPALASCKSVTQHPRQTRVRSHIYIVYPESSMCNQAGRVLYRGWHRSTQPGSAISRGSYWT